MQTTNNTIFITGGSAGIGLALAKLFYTLEGNRILICGRNPQRLAKAKQLLPDIETLVCDVSDPNQVDKAVAHLKEHAPELNVLINNSTKLEK